MAFSETLSKNRHRLLVVLQCLRWFVHRVVRDGDVAVGLRGLEVSLSMRLTADDQGLLQGLQRLLKRAQPTIGQSDIPIGLCERGGTLPDRLADDQRTFQVVHSLGWLIQIYIRYTYIIVAVCDVRVAPPEHLAADRQCFLQ